MRAASQGTDKTSVIVELTASLREVRMKPLADRLLDDFAVH
jgi:hypothetical protein